MNSGRLGVRKIKFGAVVVLYNPGLVGYDIINSLINEEIPVYVIDNSEVCQLDENKIKSGFHLIHKGCNIGLAEGYNLAATRALADGCYALCFFDQDSVIAPGIINCLDHEIKNLEFLGKSRFILGVRSGRNGESADALNAEMTIGSGLCVKLDDLVRIGFFDTNRFVDGVDEEFCLRARLKGYSIVLTRDRMLLHQIGEVRRKARVFKVYSYSDRRIEYQMRHTRMIVQQYVFFYPIYVCKKVYWQVKHLILMVAFRSGRWSRIVSVIRGLLKHI
jgi:rhamnosyltransferase